VADIVLDTVDLTVFGGPTTVDVSVDIGESGVRGTRVWSGPGSPSTYVVSTDLKLYDLYINTNTGDQYYSWLYQYVLGIGNIPTWTPLIKMNPSQYSTINSATFSSGNATINIPLSALTTSSSAVVSNFIIRYNISKNVPVSSGFTASITGTYPSQNLTIAVSGASYSGGTWSNLSGAHDVHLFISYIG
jgi:hypothetical protein